MIYVQRGSSSALRLVNDNLYYVVIDEGNKPCVLSAWRTGDEAWLEVERQRGSAAYLTCAQCAERFGFDPSTWRAAAAAGRIVGATRQIPGMVAPGKRWYIPVSSAQKYADTHRSRVRKAAAIEDEE